MQLYLLTREPKDEVSLTITFIICLNQLIKPITLFVFSITYILIIHDHQKLLFVMYLSYSSCSPKVTTFDVPFSARTGLTNNRFLQHCLKILLVSITWSISLIFGCLSLKRGPLYLQPVCLYNTVQLLASIQSNVSGTIVTSQWFIRLISPIAYNLRITCLIITCYFATGGFIADLIIQSISPCPQTLP